jgi:hypothetical protein
MTDKCSVAYCREEYQVSTPSGRYCDYHNGMRLDEMLAELRRDGVRDGQGDEQ